MALKEIITVEGFEVTIQRENAGYIVKVPELPGCSMFFEKEEKDKISSTMRDVIVERIKLAAEDKKKFPKGRPRDGKGPDQGPGDIRKRIK